MNKKTEDISAEYAAAIHAEKRGMVSATGKAKFADYSASDVDALPPGLLETSFGCGNPVAFSAVMPGQTVLDLGCGAGLDLVLAAEKVTPQGSVIGVDITDEMVSKARQNVAASGHANIDVRKGIIEALPVDTGSVDWVVSNCVINLSSEKQKVFAEIARVLKPGGRMLVSDIVAENLPYWVRRSGLLTAACAGGAISESEYFSGLSEAGLQNFHVLARQHYEPVQMAAVALDSMPTRAADLSCCGKPITKPVLETLAKPIANKLWSARIYAEKSQAN